MYFIKDEITPADLPKRKGVFIEPMNCAPVSKLPDGSQWLFEIKLDGYRAVAVKADGRVKWHDPSQLSSITSN